MATNAKLTKDEIRRPDPFLEGITELAEWVGAHRQAVLAALAGVLIVGIGIVVLTGVRQRSSETATGLYTEALKIASKEVRHGAEGTATATTAAEGAPRRKFYGSAKDKNNDLLQAYEAMMSKNGKSGAGLLACLGAARTAYELGQNEKALALYKEYLARTGPDDSMRFAALEGAGYAAEGAGRLDEALSQYSALATEPKSGTGSFYKDFAYYHQARIHEKKKDAAKAKELYEKLVKELPASLLRPLAEERIAAL